MASALASKHHPSRTLGIAFAVGLAATGTSIYFARSTQAFSSGVYRTCDDPGMCDSDQDGLADAYEAQLGTSPSLLDTDGDGMPDGREVAQGLNPLIPESWQPPTSSVRVDFVAEDGVVRVTATVSSADAFPSGTRMHVLLGIDDQVEDRTQQFVSIGRISRACDLVTRGYISSRIPLSALPRRFSIAVVLYEPQGFVFDEAWVGHRQNHFYRTELLDNGDGSSTGGTVFLENDLGSDNGDDGGFIPDQDCKQLFNRVNESIKVIANEFCQPAVERFCPDDCGSDVGLRVVCIGSLLPH